MRRAIIKAPRGGGKSKLLGTLGFDMWYFKGRKVVNMAGSQNQSEIVYNYFKDYTELNESIVKDYVKGNVTRTKTTSVNGNYFSAVTASQKQVRGKHPDVLLSDETCETDDDIVNAALPMVNSSETPLVVMASTFHQVFGMFQEVWDNAEQKGYERFSWDLFDITKEFDPEEVWNRKEVQQIPDLDQLIERADGRSGDPNGWVPIQNVISAWQEKSSIEWFDIEYMGSRPSARGLVLNPADVENAIIKQGESIEPVTWFKQNNKYTFEINVDTERIIGIDWGFSSMTSVTDFMAYKDGIKILIDNQNYSQIPSETIIEDVVERVKQGGHRYIYADSAGKFENEALQAALHRANLRCTVIEVVFSKDKEAMLGNLRAHFERGKIKLPEHLKTAIFQYKNYRYKEGSDKPVKKDDHVPDSSMCALFHDPWVLGTGSRGLSQANIQHDDDNDRPITAGLMDKEY